MSVTWAVTSGNATLSVDSTVGFVGAGATMAANKVTCNTSGTVTVVSSHVPVAPPRGVAFEVEATASATLTVEIQVDTYDASNVHTNTTGALAEGYTATSGWHPLSGNCGTNVTLSGGPTTYCVTTLTAVMTVGQVFWFDNVHILATHGQIMVDWLNPSFGGTTPAGTDFSDITWATREDSAITMTRGRQDAVSDIQPGSASFQLLNDNGWFTASTTASPWHGNITLQRRVQVNATDETGVWHTRFDGNIAGIDYELDNTGNTNVATITCADVLAFLNREATLECVTKETILAIPPLYHWTLDDTGTIISCAESSGNAGPPLIGRPFGPYYNAGSATVGVALTTPLTSTLTMASGDCGVEVWADAINFGSAWNTQATTLVGPFRSPLSTPTWTPQIVSQTNNNQFNGTSGYGLVAKLPSALNSATQAFTIEAWMREDTALNVTDGVGPYVVFSLGNSYDGSCLVTGLYVYPDGAANNTPGGMYSRITAKQYPAAPAPHVINGYGRPTASGSASISAFDNPSSGQNAIFAHHIAVQVQPSTTGATLTLFVDGVQGDSFTLPAGQSYDTLVVGSAYGGWGCFDGSIGMVSLYNSALSPAQISKNATVGRVGLQGVASDAAIAYLATLSGVPSYWNALNVPTTEYDDTVATYTSGWSVGGGVAGNPYGGATHYSPNNGTTCTFTFTGTGCQVIGSVSNNHGNFYVTVDGGSAVNTTGYSPIAMDQQVLFDTGPLPNTPHTIVMTQNQNSAYLEVDAFIVTSATGLTLVDYLNTAGVTDLSAMQSMEGAEVGLLFANTLGQLVFHTRDWRMGYGAPAYTLKATAANASLGYGLDDQFVQNDFTIADTASMFSIDVINVNSSHPYGDYSSSATLPVPIYSSGYALRGLSENAYWSDDLVSIANWRTRSSSVAALRPKNVTIDLLTLDSAHDIITVSQVYAIDIDSMIALSSMPASMALDAGALEYFIEGIQETVGLNERSVTLYTTCASISRAWIPGDATYGQLDTTARLGISQYDASTKVQPLGKALAHEPGPPYWAPVFSTTMNNPALNGHAFVGDSDLKGISETLRNALSPPLCIAGLSSNTQATTAPANYLGQLAYDTVYVDTTEGLGAVPNWPSWYLCSVPGWYDIDATVQWASIAGQLCWMIVEQDELHVMRYSFGQGPIDSSNGLTGGTSINHKIPTFSDVKGAGGSLLVTNFSTSQYLGVGDMVTVGCYSGGNSLVTANGGSMISIRWTGVSPTDGSTQYQIL
jgi:hypothetical protein